MSAAPTVARHRRVLRTTRGAAVLASAALAAAAVSAVTVPATAGTPAPPASRDRIPWSRVGSGWTLATWSPSTDPATKARISLFLVGPTGTRYLDATLPAGTEVRAFSPAAQQALLSTPGGGLADIDLRRGFTHAISIPNLDGIVGYTTPRGTSLLVSVDVPAPGGGLEARLERYGAGGRHEQNYPLTDRAAGRIDSFSVVQSPDGRELVTGAGHGLVVLRTADGAVTRRLRPAGVRSCTAASWWTRDVVLAACGGELYTVPLSGHATSHRITTTTPQTPFGYSDAWRTGARTPNLGIAENGCGPASLVRFGARGRGTRVAVPSPTGRRGTPAYVGHHADVVTMTWNDHATCERTATTLFAYDAGRNRSVAQLGPAVNGGTVTSAVPFPTDR